MTDCDSIRASLGRFLDGELSESEAEVVRLHLENCPPCGAEQRRMEKLESSLKSLLLSNGAPIAFEPFWDGVRERIAAKPNWHVDVMEWGRSIFARPALAWTIPAVIAILLAVLSLESFWKPGAQRNNFAAVESIDAHGRNVALLREDETKTTVIWLYQNQEGEDESSGENADTSPSF